MLQNILNFVLQKSCPLCNRSSSQLLCLDCQQRLSCDRYLDSTQFWQGQPKVFAWGHYANTLKRAIATMKYEQHPELAIPLGEGLARSWLQSSLCREKLVIVPVPLHRDRLKQRGFNQAELIARSFCQVTGDRLLTQELQRVRATEALFNLSASQRERVVADVFVVREQFRPTVPVLLIDDIYTTGATVRSCIQAFHRQRIRVLGVAVVARTPPNRASP